jgi:MFS family permease
VHPAKALLRLPRSLWREYRSAFAAFSRNARLFLAGSFLLGVGANQISLLWSLYLRSVGYAPGAIGETLSLRALGSALVALPASWVIARVDPRRLLPAASILVAAAYVSQTLAASGQGIAASVLLAGAFSTVFQVSSGPFFMRNSGERERIHLFSLNAALSMGTGLIGSLAGGALKDLLFGLGMAEVNAYRYALLAGAAFVLASLLPFSRLEPARAAAPSAAASALTPGAERGEGGDRIGPLLWVKLILPGFLVGLGAGLTIPYLNLYFKLEFGLGDTAIGAAVAAGQVATFLGMTASPVLARRIGKARSVFITQGLSVPLILVLAAVKSLPLALAAYLARQSLMNMSTPIQDNFALELVPPRRQGIVNAVKMLSWTGSWTIAARVSGSLIESGGFGPSFVVTASLYGLSTLLFWLFFIRGRDPAPSPSA